MSVPQVLGPYQLKAKLAVGGQSEVWLGIRRGPGGFQRRCALKLLVPPVSYDEDSQKAFIAEARLMALFEHPNLLPVTDLGHDDESSVVFAVMPYVSGTTLAALARDPAFEGLPAVEALWIVTRVLRGLAAAHELKDRGRALGIIHRDVSPENVMIGFDGQVRLIDFGIALSTINPRNTRIHVVKGKLDFLSPEQANASTRINQTTDIYSTGLLLYALLTGRNPLDGDPTTALPRARNPVVPRIDSIVTIPRELAQIVHAMLSPIPENRPQSARETGRALAAVMHRIEPLYDEHVFASHVKRWFADAIAAEAGFLHGLGEGTQIIKTGNLTPEQSGMLRDRSTPIIDAGRVLEQASAQDVSRGAESDPGATRDDLKAILAELEEIYED